MKKKIKKFCKVALQFLLNPRFLLCFGIAWMITNGWSYVLFGIGTYFDIGWMVALSAAYLAFLWLPISPEKIVTTLIAMGLLKLIFPNDTKTLGVLKALYEKYKRKKKSDEKENHSENSAL